MKNSIKLVACFLATLALGAIGTYAMLPKEETPKEPDYKTLAIFLKDIIVFEIENNGNESLEETYFDGISNMDCYVEYNTISPEDVENLPKGILTK